MSDTATFEEVKKLAKNVLLIDVREPNELQEFGIIPGSINIPLNEVANVLKNCTPNDFMSKYGKGKPSKDTPIIFTCRSGRRSQIAQESALKLGYMKVKNYAGGWLEWKERIKL